METQKVNITTMHRILAIGAPGAGKTTLSTFLAKKLSLPALHLDHLRWQPGWKLCNDTDYLEKTYAVCTYPQWVMGSMHYRTLAHRIHYADTIIFLDMSRWLCLWRIAKRVIIYKFQGLEIAPGCPAKIFDWEFFKYVWNFNKQFRNPVLRILSKTASHDPDKKIFILTTPHEVAAFARNFY